MNCTTNVLSVSCVSYYREFIGSNDGELNIADSLVAFYILGHSQDLAFDDKMHLGVFEFRSICTDYDVEKTPCMADKNLHKANWNK